MSLENTLLLNMFYSAFIYGKIYFNNFSFWQVYLFSRYKKNVLRKFVATGEQKQMIQSNNVGM